MYAVTLQSYGSHLAIDGHRPVKDTMHAQDGRLWWVNDGCAKQRAEHATIANGERATVHIFNSKLIFTSLRNKTEIITTL